MMKNDDVMQKKKKHTQNTKSSVWPCSETKIAPISSLLQ